MPSPRVEVLNGSGIAGAAQRVADQLSQAGFEVTRTDNAPSSDYDRSQVIAHKGRTEPVMRIARLVGCDRVVEDGTENQRADVTVIVGRSQAYQ